MSVFNETESQIREAVSSILNQTWQDLELIIVCDNPKRDDIETIIGSFSDNRIVLLKNEANIGLAMSMNRAAECSHSEILARMDADDVAMPDRLEKEHEIIMKKGVDVVFSDFEYIDMFSQKIEDMVHQFPVAVEGCVESKIIAQRPNIIHHPTVMMKREIFDKVGGYRDFPCSQDADLWYRMQEAGAKFYLLNEKLLQYRINPNSVTNKKFYLQQLTVHYINTLSLQRLKTGKDSYSKEDYQNFLKEYGYESVYKKKLYMSGFKLLEKALTTGRLMSTVYRVMAFIISPQLRYNYLIGIKKKKLLDAIS